MFQKDAVWSNISTTRAYPMTSHESKVIIEKSRGEGSLMEQDTIENVSQPIFLRKKYFFSNFILCQKILIFSFFLTNNISNAVNFFSLSCTGCNSSRFCMCLKM